MNFESKALKIKSPPNICAYAVKAVRLYLKFHLIVCVLFISMADNRFVGLRNVFARASAFGNETGTLPNGEYEPSEDTFAALRNAKILVIGAGGLGCEILKDLALSGVTYMHVIDLDTIDVTNLNRQFLFRKKDVGRGKAEVAAEFVMSRVPGCQVIPHQCKIQDMPHSFYEEFNVIISGLDNVEARRWLNSMLHGITTRQIDEDGEEYFDGIIPMIDGGTEGFKGQARLIIPRCTACFECTIASIAPATGFAMCTIAETPRIPQHCIAYAYMSLWEKEFGDRKVDTDSVTDMNWIYEKALERAKAYGIEGVTYFLTMGVVKNIIPAVASTNATIAAACCNEAIKLITFAGQSLNCNYMIMGNEGFYSSTFEYERNRDCIVCSNTALARVVKSSKATTLKEFLNMLKENPSFQLKEPSVSCTSGTGSTRVSRNLFLARPPALRKATEENLSKTLTELGLFSGDFLGITDPVLFMPLNIELELS